MSEILDNTKSKMDKALDALRTNLTTIRTGRANPSILDQVSFEYYGSMTPINQVASIQVVEGRQLLIKVFEKSILKDVERAISMSDTGLVPQNDGDVIRIMIPSLTEDRRKELSKVAHKYGEDSKVVIRNIRRDGNDTAKKNKDLTDDMKKNEQDDIQKLTDEYIKKIDIITADKMKDILSV